MNPILTILTNRDLLSSTEARATLFAARQRLAAGVEPAVILNDLGLGPEYIDDLIGD